MIREIKKLFNLIYNELRICIAIVCSGSSIYSKKTKKRLIKRHILKTKSNTLKITKIIAEEIKSSLDWGKYILILKDYHILRYILIFLIASFIGMKLKIYNDINEYIKLFLGGFVSIYITLITVPSLAGSFFNSGGRDNYRNQLLILLEDKKYIPKVICYGILLFASLMVWLPFDHNSTIGDREIIPAVVDVIFLCSFGLCTYHTVMIIIRILRFMRDSNAFRERFIIEYFAKKIRIFSNSLEKKRMEFEKEAKSYSLNVLRPWAFSFEQGYIIKTPSSITGHFGGIHWSAIEEYINKITSLGYRISIVSFGTQLTPEQPVLCIHNFSPQVSPKKIYTPSDTNDINEVNYETKQNNDNVIHTIQLLENKIAQIIKTTSEIAEKEKKYDELWSLYGDKIAKCQYMIADKYPDRYLRDELQVMNVYWKNLLEDNYYKILVDVSDLMRYVADKNDLWINRCFRELFINTISENPEDIKIINLSMQQILAWYSWGASNEQ